MNSGLSIQSNISQKNLASMGNTWYWTSSWINQKDDQLQVVSVNINNSCRDRWPFLQIWNRKYDCMAEKLKGIQDLFNLLCRSAAELNSLFSIPVLYFVTTRIITTAICLFLLTAKFLPSSKDMTVSDDMFAYFMSGLTLPCMITIGVILTAGDMPVQEVLNLICHHLAFTDL